MELSELQHLYLQTVFNYFHLYGEWPTFQYVDRELIHTVDDIEEIIKSLPDGLTNPFNAKDPTDKALLSVPAIYLCQGSESDLQNFALMIRLCVEKYFSLEQESPQFSSDELRDVSGMSDVSIHKVGLLVRQEPNIYRVFGTNDDNSWSIEIARGIRRFRDIKSIEQYLEKRNTLSKVASSVTHQDAQLPLKDIILQTQMEDIQLHPDIHSRCWNQYSFGNYDDAILNATKCLEVAVRTKAHIPADKVGAEVMNQAFSLSKTILKYSDVRSEQESMMYLTRGIIGVFKNPQSHRFVDIQSKSECLGVLLMCSNLLYVVENTTYIASP